MSEWISVKDRLPKQKGILYIVCRTIKPYRIVFAAIWDGVWLSVAKRAPLEYITHWMPMPEPPVEKTKEEIEEEMWSLMS